MLCGVPVRVQSMWTISQLLGKYVVWSTGTSTVYVDNQSVTRKVCCVEYRYEYSLCGQSVSYSESMLCGVPVRVQSMWTISQLLGKYVVWSTGTSTVYVDNQPVTRKVCCVEYRYEYSLCGQSASY